MGTNSWSDAVSGDLRRRSGLWDTDGQGGTVFCKLSGAQGQLLPLWEEGVDVGVSELTGEHLVCDERGADAARTTRRHVSSGR